MVMQSLEGLPAFVAYFCLTAVAVIAFLLIYTRITPYNDGRRSLFSPSTSHTSVPSVGRSAGSRGGFGSVGHSVGAHSSGG